MLDEKTKRRECCDPASSVPVRLADGQEWLFPKPWLQVQAVFHEGKAVDAIAGLTYGPELQDLIRLVAECEDNLALCSAAATLGSHILRHNYDLADQDLDQLFAFRVGDPSSWDWVPAILHVARGEHGPKRGSGGGS
jgi:hypothetical protein